MKKLILVFILFIVLITLIGCTKPTLSDNIKDSGSTFTISLSEYTANEWVSPDGVHYWVFSYGYHFGVAPRYDENGNIVKEN